MIKYKTTTAKQQDKYYKIRRLLEASHSLKIRQKMTILSTSLQRASLQDGLLMNWGQAIVGFLLRDMNYWLIVGDYRSHHVIFELRDTIVGTRRMCSTVYQYFHFVSTLKYQIKEQDGINEQGG